jgi:hypothetical protein
MRSVFELTSVQTMFEIISKEEDKIKIVILKFVSFGIIIFYYFRGKGFCNA